MFTALSHIISYKQVIWGNEQQEQKCNHTFDFLGKDYLKYNPDTPFFILFFKIFHGFELDLHFNKYLYK